MHKQLHVLGAPREREARKVDEITGYLSYFVRHGRIQWILR
jgi:hypothetical protein